MLKTVRQRLILILVGVIAGGSLLYPREALAFVGCTATSSPHSVTAGSSVSFQFNLTNTGTDDLHYIRFTRQNANISYSGGSASGWALSFSGNDAVFTGSTLIGGDSQTFTVTTNITGHFSPGSWLAAATSSPNGSGAVGCSGNLTLSDSSAPAPPTISSITVGSIGTGSATVSWSTDQPADSTLNFGNTASYGQTVSSATATTTHSLNVSGLSPATSYHYQVASQNANGGSSSGDNTFTTATASTPGTSTPTLPATPTQTGSPPTLTITGVAKPVAQPPTITGSALDDKAVKNLDYSTDGGVNWQPISANGLGGKTVSFSFTPTLSEDGNYQIVARAFDNENHEGRSNTITIVIDRLPPIVGGNLITTGPLILQPQSDGSVQSIVGLDTRVTMNAAGGPIRIDVVASVPNDSKSEQSFSLTREAGSSLWSGILSFTTAGKYNLTVNALDGAGNRTSRQIESISVAAPGHLRSGSKAVNGQLTTYYRPPGSFEWTVWDGASYGQTNPQITGPDGGYSLYLPPGRYYIEAKASGFQSVVSQILDLDHPQTITADLSLKPTPGFTLGPFKLSWPTFPQTTKIALFSPTISGETLIGHRLPAFDLLDNEGHHLRSSSLLGKPTLVSLIEPWAPTTSEQLPLLASLNDSRFNLAVISSLDNGGRLNAYLQASSLKLPVLFDPTAVLATTLGVRGLPTHLLVDRAGVIKKVMVGVSSNSELLHALEGL